MLSYKSAGLLFVALSLSSGGCGTRHKAKPQLGEVERWPRLETIFPEKEGRLTVRKTYAATVEAFEKADLCAQVRGVIKVLGPDVDIGRRVRANDVLVVLDIPDIEAEKTNKLALLEQSKALKTLAAQACDVAAKEVAEVQAGLRRYQADVDFRKLQYDRVMKLAQGETVSRQFVEENALQLGSAQAALQASQAQVMTKQARLESANVDLLVADNRIKVAQSELDRVQTMVDFATIRAPFDGVITKRWVDRGATIKDPGIPLLTVMRTDPVRVIIDVPERDVPFIQAPSPMSGGKGNPVDILIPALQQSLGIGTFKAALTLRASALDPVTRTMRCEIHLPNNADYLKSQMTGTATVLLAERTALTLPSSALVRNGSKVEIFYIASPTGSPPKGIVKRLEVQLGLDDGQRVEIISDTLTVNEHVIRKGSGMVRAGDYAIMVPVSTETANQSAP